MLDEEIRWAVTRVLSGRERLGFLLRSGLDGMLDMRRFLVHVLPLARIAITQLAHLAERIPDDELRAQALTSLHGKAYHIAGAGILATFLPPKAREHYIEIVAPLEAIYDFLDSLCDRHPDTPVRAFRALHEALADALDPARALHPYYIYGPQGDDGGYLSTLVRRVRAGLVRLREYELLLPLFRTAADLYSDTQTFKHLPAQEREAACIAWFNEKGEQYRDLSWWEFGAACGSQFHVYAPLYAAFRSEFEYIPQTYNAYFPALAALHVLLDSFIDQAEDATHGELNWVTCYPSNARFIERARELAGQTRERFRTLPMPRAHIFTLRTMSLFYLTHPKIQPQGLDREARELLRALS